MIVRGAYLPAEGEEGAVQRLGYSDAGALTQYGAYVETLPPGAGSSERHWHEQEDEFLYVLSGEATVVENDGEHTLGRGDAACWPAGVPNAHRVENRSDSPCSYLIFGTRMARDAVHYPDTGRVLRDRDGRWQMLRLEDGSIIDGGEIDQVRPMTWTPPPEQST